MILKKYDIYERRLVVKTTRKVLHLIRDIRQKTEERKLFLTSLFWQSPKKVIRFKSQLV